MKRNVCKALSLIMAVLVISAAMVTAAFADEAPQYTTRGDIVGYSAALVERRDLSGVTNIQKYWEDEDGLITEYKIESAADLVYFSGLVEAKQNFRGFTVYLANDIDLSSETVFAPIGGWSASNASHPWATIYFAGTFDGQGYSVKNMNMTMPAYDSKGVNGLVGFFRCLGSGAEVRNLVIDESCVVSGGTNVRASVIGAVAGAIDTNLKNNVTETDTVKLINIYSAADVVHGGVAGGLVGVAKSAYITIDHCTAAGDVRLVDGAEGASFNGRGVGGIIGQMGETKVYAVSVKITNTRNAGDITAYDGPVGGLVGHFPTTASTDNVKSLEIENCINTGKITLTDETYNTENSKGIIPAVGGLVGLYGINTSGGALTVKTSANYGNVSVQSSETPLNQIANTTDDAVNVTLTGNLEKMGETDASLAEALWQNLVKISTPEPSVTPDDGNNNGGTDGTNSGGNGEGNNGVQNGTNETENVGTETVGGDTADETDAEKSGGCGSVIALLPVSLCAVGAAVLALRKKED